MKKVRILQDIKGGKGKTYAKKYEVVMVISQHDNVLIVEGKERFSVHIDKTEAIDV